MSKVIFAKYNKSRKREFQISTVLYEENGKRFARKTPITDAAASHVSNMRISYGKLKGVYTNITLLEGGYEDKGVIFEFVEGKTITDKLLEAASKESKEQFLEDVRRLVNHIFETRNQLTTFEKSKEFIEVFGDIAISDMSMSITNIDMIFDNIVERNNQMICLDYEWVFDFKVPVRYVYYRSIHYFYSRNAYKFQNKITEKEIMNACGMDDDAINAFEKMEESFQRWVFGEEKYTLRYVKNVESNIIQNYKHVLSRVIELQNEEEDRNKHIKHLDEQIEGMEYELRKSQKLIHDKDVHIRNLEALVALKDAQIQRQERILGFVKKIPFITKLKKPAKTVWKFFRRIKNCKALHKLQIPQCAQPMVSIIIPVYNQFDYTYECIKSVINHTQDVPYEIIVADDVSTDATRKIGRYIKGITVIRNQKNLKFLLNCNNAAKAARGKYIFFLNNDTQVTEGWLSSLVELIESDESIGMVGSKLIYPDGRLQEAGGILWKDASAWNYGNGQNPEAPEYNYVREVDYISGAAIMIKMDLWKKIGGFDEKFVPAYCEDSDLAFQVRKKGYKVFYQPKSVVIHYEGISNGTDTSTGLKHYQVVNNEKFKEKWSNELSGHYENGEAVFMARERNFGDRRVVLFIDHYVPQFDKDAGSKTVYQYIKMFLSKGYSVKFIGDNYYKHEPYTTILNQMGVEVLHGSWYADHIFEWLKENSEYIDFVFMNRPHITEKYIDFFRENMRAKIVYYGHDLHFLRLEREYELTGDDEKRVEAVTWKRKELDVMKKAAVTYYPSCVEIEAIHELDPGIPAKAITAYVFDEFREKFQYIPENREGILFVGGFSHDPNVDAVKWFVNDIYPMIREQEEIPFYIVGSNAPEEVQQMDGNGVIFKGFVTEEELHELYHKTRIVVVPLRYGAGVKGKVVEALYYGTPLVTTSVGAEGIIGIENVAIVKDGEQEFAQELLRLYHDDKQLKEMAEKSRVYIKDHFSIDAAWKVIEEDFA